MNRGEMLEVFARYRGDAPVIVGPGICGRILYTIGHHPATIYNMELGYAAAMCVGLPCRCRASGCSRSRATAPCSWGSGR